MPHTRARLIPVDKLASVQLVPMPAEWDAFSIADSLDHQYQGNEKAQSQKALGFPFVEMAGIEPASDDWPRDILRVQSAVYFSAFSNEQTRSLNRHSQLNVGFHPLTPRNPSGFLNDARNQGRSNPWADGLKGPAA